MRTFLMCMVLAACAAGAAQTVATSHHKVAWGWGCGGNCAVNFSGESETTLANDPPGVHLEDHGMLTRRENSPGGTTITETR